MPLQSDGRRVAAGTIDANGSPSGSDGLPRLRASFFATDPATIRLERGDRTVTMWLVGAAGDGKYEAQNVDLVHQGNTLQMNWLDTNTGKTDQLQCQAR